MRRIGLTGGIGSGKSTVSRIFSALGVPCYIADERSKALLNTNQELRIKLIEHFGNVYSNGSIDKKLFASIIFGDDAKRQLANELIHPFVRADFDTWSSQQRSAYVIQEAAILFETGAFQYFDKNILVCAPIELKLARIEARDKVSREHIMARIDSQWSDEKKRGLADYCIENDEKGSLIQQVLDIHTEIKLASN
jgi:dephospho-CoA kinase